MVNYCRSPRSLVGKTVIVTGANSGLGYETALEFAKRGGRVILACRNRERAQEACKTIIAQTGNENVVVKIVDMESFASVREFAKDIQETEPRLDILVNNAGAVHKKKITEDGHQLAMQVNHHSTFLLTLLLLDLLKKSAPSRIVIVSSIAANSALGFDVNNLDKYMGPWLMYGKTKLCNILFAQELARRLQGSGVTVYSVHPGVVLTEIFNTMPFWKWIVGKFFLHQQEGAQTQIHCSLQDGIEEHTGKHFENCRPVSPYWTARETEKSKRLWKVTEKIVGIETR